MATKRKPLSKKRKLINLKTKRLIEEGYDPKQAYAVANSLSREGRIGPKGGLLKKTKKAVKRTKKARR